ncbi:hypothetical protein [Nocardioides sp. zg-DK7169]|uniref:hypothetical protein n=1 Tax=Nocardioides sp. zg-DK7169 TaxID=2736600 RepID=UPI001554B292|nr:hypothetical protein [Nocardioides sp. zg-DK7169]NPC95398.1 hypothetical protein [Nocardioides sp. zg-DK7169]
MAAQQDNSRPESVRRALQVLWALVAFGAVAVLLTWIFEDDLVRSWAEGHRSVRDVLASGGVEAVEQGVIKPPAFVPVTAVIYLVMAGMLAVLAPLFAAGFEWARVCLIVTLLTLVIGVGAILITAPPAMFLVLSVVGLVLTITLLVLLVHKDTTAYLHSWSAEDRDTVQR